MDVRNIVTEYVLRQLLLGDTSITIHDDDSFLEHDLIDSTGVLELVAFIEEQFGITVEDEELIPDNLDSIDNLTEYVQLKVHSEVIPHS